MSKYNPLTDTIEGQVFEASLGLLKCRMCMKNHPFYASEEGTLIFFECMHMLEDVKSYCEKHDTTQEILKNNNILICPCGTGLRLNMEPVKQEVVKEPSRLVKV